MNKRINHDFIKRIELELLSALIDYVIPFIDKKPKPQKKEAKRNNLENIINQQPKIIFDDFRKLENVL